MTVNMTPEQQKEAFRLLDLIVAEWQSDPTLVASFDLNVIVYPAQKLVEELWEQQRG